MAPGPDGGGHQRPRPAGRPDRSVAGALVADFLRGREPAAVHIDRLATVAGAYAPFNLLLADSDSLEYLGNHPAERQTLGPGVHGMSNGALDAPGRRPGG